MPSWNLHAYHTKNLLDNQELSLHEYLDPEAFKLGNIAPDIYVGYMVNPISKTLPYEDTHCSDTQEIPVPDPDRFWDTYIEPVVKEGKVPDAVLVGVWLHLITDKNYNDATRSYIKTLGLHPCRDVRIRKQADFAAFGKSVCPDMEIKPTDEVFTEAKRFAQYPIEKEDAQRAIDVFNSIVREDSHHVSQGDYQLLSQEWFDQVSSDVDAELLAAMKRVKQNIRH